jgi:hypothetical protein
MSNVLPFERPWPQSCLPRCPRKPDHHMAIRVGPGLVKCVHCEAEGLPALPIPAVKR